MLLASPCILFRSFGFNFKFVYKWGHPWKIPLVCNKKTMCKKWWELVALVQVVYYKAILQEKFLPFDHEAIENIQDVYLKLIGQQASMAVW